MRHGWKVLALLVLPAMSHATSIVTTSSIDLTTTTVSQAVDQIGVTYQWWNVTIRPLDVPIGSATVGDTITFRLLFEDGLGVRIRDKPGEAYYRGNAENIAWTLLSSTAQQTDLSYSVTFLDAVGFPLANPVTGLTDQCYGSGICSDSDAQADFVAADRFLVFGGLEIQIILNQVALYGGGQTVLNLDRYATSITADEVNICRRFPGIGQGVQGCFPAPEPGTLALLGLGLAGLGLSRGRKACWKVTGREADHND